MKVIITHKNTDFDALASLVAAHKLYPDAVPVLGYFKNRRVQEFISLHKDAFNFSSPKAVKWDEVTDIILVDFQELSRGDGLEFVTDITKFNWIIYDHHPEQKLQVEPVYSEVRQTGSTAGMLVKHLKEKNIKPTFLEATLMGIGIYADTGHLTFPNTTVDDVLAVAWLLENKADLNIIAEYTSMSLQYDQMELMNKLIEKMEIIEYGTTKALFTACISEKYIHDLSVITYKLSELYSVDIVFVAVKMDKRTYIIGQSSTTEFNVLISMVDYDPKGHKQAGFAKIKEGDPVEVIENIKAKIEKISKTGVIARDIMSSPVRTIPKSMTIENTHKLMLRYGHNGFIVTDEETVEGIITRRDIEKAMQHKLDKHLVQDFMSKYIVPISTDTSFGEIEKLMIENNMGRFPVIEKGTLVGIVTRTDILKALYNKEIDKGELHLPFDPESTDSKSKVNLEKRMKEYFANEHYELLVKVGHVADSMGYNAYLVGGLVRDLIIGTGKDVDIDIVIEGNGIKFAAKLASELKAQLITHDKYGTAKIKIPDGFIDIATARTEFYEYPAANPDVDFSTIKQDLYRRDFTINAIAIHLNKDTFGKILDFFYGYRDIYQKKLRVLHNLSFIEDPVRILRAVRMERKLGFSLGKPSNELAIRAMNTGKFDHFINDRMKTELRLLFSNKYDPVANIKRLSELSAIRCISVKTGYEEVEKKLRRAYRYSLIVRKYLNVNINEWIIYMAILLENNSLEKFEKVISQLRLTKEEQKTAEFARHLPELIDSLTWNELSDSDIYFFWKKYSPEALIYALSISENKTTKKSIYKFWTKLKDIRLKIDGSYIKKLGIKEGLKIGGIIESLLLAKLNGKVITEEDEYEFAKKIVEENE